MPTPPPDFLLGLHQLTKHCSPPTCSGRPGAGRSRWSRRRWRRHRPAPARPHARPPTSRGRAPPSDVRCPRARPARRPAGSCGADIQRSTCGAQESRTGGSCSHSGWPSRRPRGPLPGRPAQAEQVMHQVTKPSAARPALSPERGGAGGRGQGSGGPSAGRPWARDPRARSRPPGVSRMARRPCLPTGGGTTGCRRTREERRVAEPGATPTPAPTAGAAWTPDPWRAGSPSIGAPVSGPAECDQGASRRPRGTPRSAPPRSCRADSQRVRRRGRVAPGRDRARTRERGGSGGPRGPKRAAPVRGVDRLVNERLEWTGESVRSASCALETTALGPGAIIAGGGNRDRRRRCASLTR